MKKAVRLLIAAVLLLAVAVVLVLVLNQQKENSEGEIKTEAVSQTKIKDIEAMTYTSESTGGKPVTLVRENDIWYYEEDKEFPLDQDYVTNTMVMTAAQATANQTLDNPSDNLEEYGLTEPAVTIVLKKVSDEEVTMKIGAYNESVEGYYLKVEGDDKIYLVDGKMVFAFDMSIYEIADKEDYPLVETTSFTHIKIEKENNVVELKGEIEEDSGEYVLNNSYIEKEKTWKISDKGAVYKTGNQEKIKELLSSMSAFDFSSMAAYKPSDKEKETFGLNTPAVTLTVDYEVLDETTAREVEGDNGIGEIVCDTLQKQYVLYIGNQVPENGYDDSAYYVALEGSSAVYTMKEDALSSIMDLNVNSYKQ